MQFAICHRPFRRPPSAARPARGFTLVELLVAIVLTLLLMGVVITMFGRVSSSVADSRATLEMADRLRSTAAVLQQDLAGITVTPIPPRRPENNEGYLEIIEGPMGTQPPMALPQTVAVDNSDPAKAKPDTTVTDFDDILMFTTRSTGRPFVGRCGTGTIESDVAEVAWFVRGRTLYRRVLLVAPAAPLPPSANQFYCYNDISVRVQNGQLVANTLGDLTRRECRYAHPTDLLYPYDARRWGLLGLPTLQECSSTWNMWNYSATMPPSNGDYARLMVPSGGTVNQIDFWSNGPILTTSGSNLDTYLATGGTRVAEDVILTDVIGFDVKVWDPGALAYVDLGYNTNLPSATTFSGAGDTLSGLNAATPLFARVYDTWSTTYQNYTGFDTNNNGIVDDVGDAGNPPPYPVALRGIRVTIRVFEPSSRQVREVTVIQDFLPK